MGDTVRLRPDWDDYFLGIAEAVSKRGDCTRRQVGALIVDSGRRIVSTGYNGATPGTKGCLEWGACPRGRHYALVGRAFSPEIAARNCACGNTWPCDKAVPSGSSYDTGPGACIAIHAEMNALLYAFRSVAGMTMYITTEPCDGCLKPIRGAQISRVVTPTGVIRLSLPLRA